MCLSCLLQINEFAWDGLTFSKVVPCDDFFFMSVGSNASDTILFEVTLFKFLTLKALICMMVLTAIHLFRSGRWDSTLGYTCRQILVHL